MKKQKKIEKTAVKKKKDQRINIFRRKLKYKLSLIFGILILILFIIIGSSLFMKIKSDLYQSVYLSLENANRYTRKIIHASSNVAISNHLKATALSAKRILQFYYNKQQKGELSKDQAMEKAKEVLLSEYGKIEKSTSLFVITPKGEAVFHPAGKVSTLEEYEYIKKVLYVITLKDGYAGYMWSEKENLPKRQKFSALSYFAPWNLIVWAGGYQEEMLNLVNVDDFKKEVLSFKLGKSGYVFIMDLKANIVLHPVFNKEYNVYEMKDAEGKFLFKTILEKKDGFLRYKWIDPDVSGKRGKIAYFKIDPLLQWMVVSTYYVDEFSGTLYETAIFFVFSVLFFFIVNIIVIVSIFSKILKPFKTIQEVVASVNKGDLTREITIKRHDEIGEVSVFFNNLLTQFRSLAQQVDHSLKTLFSAVQNLSSSSREISTTSNQQAAAVKEIVTTMEDSTSLTRQIASKISEVANISFSTKNSVEDGVVLIHNTMSKMNEIRTKNNDTIMGIRSLGDKIESIWEVVNIINTIADQTKIIAFNAALEAASAGDAGKNFQIVASEIRRLADNTMNSTREIKEKINEIQTSSNNLIVMSEEGTQKINEGWDFAQSLQEVFSQILESADVSSDSASEISASTEQQVLSFDQTLLTLKEISDGVQHFAISTRQTAEISESLQEIAQSLKKIISGYTLHKKDLSDFDYKEITPISVENKKLEKEGKENEK